MLFVVRKQKMVVCYFLTPVTHYSRSIFNRILFKLLPQMPREVSVVVFRTCSLWTLCHQGDWGLCVQTASTDPHTPAVRTSCVPAVMEVRPGGNEPGNLKQVNVKYKSEFENILHFFYLLLTYIPASKTASARAINLMMDLRKKK